MTEQDQRDDHAPVIEPAPPPELASNDAWASLDPEEIVPAEIVDPLVDSVREAIARLERELVEARAEEEARAERARRQASDRKELHDAADDLLRMAATLRDEAEAYRRETLDRARVEATKILDVAAGRTPA